MKTGFKYDLGAALILVTSVPLLHEQMQFDKEEEDRRTERAQLPPPGEDDEAEIFLSAGRLSMGVVEHGEVIGRAEYVNAEPSYLMRYRDGSGRQVDEFVPESGLTTWDEAEESFATYQRVQAEQAAAAAGGEPAAEAAPAAEG